MSLQKLGLKVYRKMTNLRMSDCEMSYFSIFKWYWMYVINATETTMVTVFERRIRLKDYQFGNPIECRRLMATVDPYLLKIAFETMILK